MSKIINWFREHDGIEIVLVYLPVAVTAAVIVYYFIDGIISRIMS